jgi:ribosomal protein S18 acetylase RimI-like enzyme
LDNESDVGIMQWGDQGGKITELYVGKDFRRQGVATGMMEHARRIAKENPNVPEPQHNQFRSRAGDAWARKVGGDVPPLDKGGFMPYED